MKSQLFMAGDGRSMGSKCELKVVAQLRDLTGEWQRQEWHAREDVVWIGGPKRARQPAAIVFTTPGADDGFCRPAIDTWNELKGGGRSRVDVEFAAGDWSEKFSQADIVAGCLRGLTEASSTLLESARQVIR